MTTGQRSPVLTRSRLVAGTRVLLLLAAAAALEVFPRIGVVSRLEVVPFSEMFMGVALIWEAGDLWQNLFASLATIVSAWLAATFFGLILGYVLWRLPSVYGALSPYLVSYYAVPIFAFYPVLIVIFGADRTPIFVIAAGWAIVAVIVSTVEGLASVQETWEKVATVYHLPLWRRALRVHLPAALPHAAVGIKLAVTYSILGVIASEFILSGEGLGYLVASYFNGFKLQQMWGAILLVFAVGISLNSIAQISTDVRRFSR